MTSDNVKPSPGALAQALFALRTRGKKEVLDDLMALQSEMLRLIGPDKTRLVFERLAAASKGRGRPRGSTKFPDDQMLYVQVKASVTAREHQTFKEAARHLAMRLYEDRATRHFVGQSVDAMVKRMTSMHTEYQRQAAAFQAAISRSGGSDIGLLGLGAFALGRRASTEG